MPRSEGRIQTPPIVRGEVHLWRLTTRSSRTASRRILSAYAGVESIDSSDHGDLSFSLSHSGPVTLLAVGMKQAMGVDVEHVRNGVRIADLARRFFSASEVAALLATAPEERIAAFFRTWVRKEAYLKALRCGLGVPAGLSRFSVTVAADRPPAILETRLEDGGASALALYDLDAPPGCAGALAVEGTDHKIRSFDEGDLTSEAQRGTG